MKSVGILGCGWLGLPLARTLVENNWLVKGSTTSQKRMILLQENGVDPYLIALGDTQIDGQIEAFLNKLDVLIIAIPPKVATSDFTKKIQLLIPELEKSEIKNIIFISSTSVYDDLPNRVTEQTQTRPTSASGKQLVLAEQLLQTHPDFKTTVIRFGGLIGDDRNPVTFLSGRKNIENPDAPINLIHQKDCIGIILKIIEQEQYGNIFNAVAPFHPTRKSYYTNQAMALNLPLPEFAAHGNAGGKTVSSEKIEKILGYHFAFPNLQTDNHHNL